MDTLLTRQPAAHSLAEAVSALLYPHAEVVLHDLAGGRIAAIWNGFSRRAPGDASLLDEEPGAFDAVSSLGPYDKTGEDGRRLKSVTAVLRDAAGRPEALLCINLDVSRLEGALQLIAAFIAPAGARPPSLFSRDWRETLNEALHAWLKARGLALAALGRAEKVALVAALDAQGLFATRHAAGHLAALIGVSRATVYNYLAAARAGKEPSP